MSRCLAAVLACLALVSYSAGVRAGEEEAKRAENAVRVLRESGFASVRTSGTRRLYAVDAAPLRDVDEWLARFRNFWAPPLAALATELARGRRNQQRQDRP